MEWLEREEETIYMGWIREISLKRDECHVDLIPWRC